MKAGILIISFYAHLKSFVKPTTQPLTTNKNFPKSQTEIELN